MRGVTLALGLLALTAPLAAQDRAALEDLERRARRDSNDAVAHYDLAMGYWARKKWDLADRELRTAVAIAPSYADAWLALSAIFEAQGERYHNERIERLGEDSVRAAYEASARYFRRAFQLNPLVDLRVLGRAEPRRGIFVPIKFGNRFGYIIPAPPWEKDLVRGLNEVRQGRYPEAYRRLTELAEDRRFGGNDMDLPAEILWYRGLAAAHVSEFDRAIRDFAILTRRAFDRESDTTYNGPPLATNDYRYILATLLYLAGRHDQAVPVFQRALEFDLGLWAAHVQLARMHEGAGRLPEALAERRLAVAANPDEAEPHVDLAMTLLRGGQNAEALQSLGTAEELNRRDARIPYLRGVVAYHVGDSAQGRAAFGRFLAIAPSRMTEQVAEVRARLGAP